MKNIDTNLYSRQIKTYGIEIMTKLQSLSIIIVGMRGIGVEIAKNLVLSGVKAIKIFDENICKINDLGNNFYLSEKNIGEKRDVSCLEKLKELNSYVNIEIFRGNLIENICDFDVVVITEIMNEDLLFKINEKCHEKNIGFIYCLSLGLSGFIFSDFGEKHIITDPTGKEKQIYFIKNFDKSGMITIDQTNKEEFNLKKGDYVKFKEVEGIKELNDGNPKKIINISKNKFAIEGKYDYENYKVGGIIEEVIMPKTFKYRKLKDCFNKPYFENNIPDTNDHSKEGRNELLFIAFLAIHNYYKEKKKLPEINNLEESNEVLRKAKLIFETAKNNNEKWIDNLQGFDEQIIMKVAKWSKCEISPCCSFIGGIVAQEVIKKTGKYIPINQWFRFDFFETVKDLNENSIRILYGSRYDEQIAIFGEKVQNKLNNLNVFIIGAGAVGCELLKIFALMGISINKGSKTTITDNDLIETSNLNRQFLYNHKDIGKQKSKIASEKAKLMNDQFKCKDLHMLVNNENEDYFNEKFWENQDFILTAVDTQAARQYIDNQCTKYSKHLIDTGTLGTSASCQVIIPFKTSCYNDNPPNWIASIPMCTIRNFPSKIEHCIEWGLIKFKEYFTVPVEDLKKFLENKEDFLNSIKDDDVSNIVINRMERIKQLLEYISEDSFDKIIKESIYLYFENYIFGIKRLLKDFPENHTNENGSLFWSGSKRFPNVIDFNIYDNDCLNFIKYYSILLSRSINVKIIKEDNEIRKIAEKVQLPEYIYKTKKTSSRKEELEIICSLKNFLKNYDIKNIEKGKIIPEYFEKDNDLNNHVYFINLCANLRAKNYRIPCSTEQNTKMIAGKIVPAIASTTAAITGFSCLQLLTLIISNDNSLVKNCYFDTAINLYNFVIPSDANHTQDQEYNIFMNGPSIAIPKGWTVWDIICIKGPMTCKDFIEYFKKKYNVIISGISCNGKSIIQLFVPNDNKKLLLRIEEIYQKTNNLKKDQTCLWLIINGKINDVDADMPKIKYIFK